MSQSSRIAIVTGGGSGIGRATARALSAAGWTVAISGRRRDALEETVAMAGAGPIEAIAADVTDPASVDTLFQTVVERHGRLDLLFNNAGANVRGIPYDELAVSDLLKVVNTNLIGSMLCARAAMRVMKAQTPQGGRIINNGSVSAYAPRPNSAPYTASKHAITGLTKALSLDGRPFGIACGQVDIGNATTEMSASLATEAQQANGSVLAEPRFDASEVGDMVVHMAGLPLTTNVAFVTIMATTMPLYGRG